ncbi:hypothetical protein HanIR_Chr16g0828611 [Helianthus annuus]|nr:hypothetical protein HanIR_Chr16g0828611 [Helianthus annuus]
MLHILSIINTTFQFMISIPIRHTNNHRLLPAVYGRRTPRRSVTVRRRWRHMRRSRTVNHCITGRIRLITAGIRRPGRGWISDRSNCLTYSASD